MADFSDVVESAGFSGVADLADLTRAAPAIAADPMYLLGRTDAETQRLIRHPQLYNPCTRRLLEEAGITAGMRVLDVGTGAGDVALLVASLVGSSGSVVGMDTNPRVLRAATERTRAAGFDNVTFCEGDFRTLEPGEPFDAIVGRSVLAYVANPAEALWSLAPHLRPGGVAVFQEMDVAPLLGYLAHTSLELGRQIVEWVCAVFTRCGAHSSMGTGLVHSFYEAGLGTPQTSMYAPLGCGVDWAGYDYVAEFCRSLLPLLEGYGIATTEQVHVNTLAIRLCAEALTAQQPMMLFPLVGAWARKR